MTEGKNNNSESQKEQPKFNQEQYEFLKDCSEKGPDGIKKWNKWRADNPDKDILLKGADLSKCYLKKVILNTIVKKEIEGQVVEFGGKAYLGEIDFRESNLEAADLLHAYAEGTHFELANLKRARLNKAHLAGARFWRSELQETLFICADLKNAQLQDSHLEKAKFHRAIMHNAFLIDSHLAGSIFYKAFLQGANFQTTLVDGATSFWGCEVDENTNFAGVGLDNIRIESGIKTLLKCNIRRMNWMDWYEEHRFLQWPVKLFWSLSNYGISTLRIAIWFFGLALFFAGLYYILSVVSPPGVVNSLVEGKEGSVPAWLIPFRSIYFSIVTMTTLGFGDMHANCRSFLGHLLLTIQVILGYVLLGALVTRLAVLFTSDGPAGSFTPMDKETKELLAKLKEDREN